MTSGPITSWQIEGEKAWTVTGFISLGSKITLDSDCSHEVNRCLLLERKAMKNLHSMLKSKDITLLTKVHIVKATLFGSHVQMWELDHKEGWAPKNWCFWTVVLEKTLLDCKEIQPVHPKGDQSWVFIGRTETEALILQPPDAKSWLIRKDPDAGKDRGQKGKGATEDEMVEWHHWLGQEFGQTPGDSHGQGILVWCSLWVAKSHIQLSNRTTKKIS